MRARQRQRKAKVRKYERERKRENEGDGEVEPRDRTRCFATMVHHTHKVSMLYRCVRACVHMCVCVWERAPSVRGVRTEWKWKGSALACLLNED